MSLTHRKNESLYGWERTRNTYKNDLPKESLAPFFFSDAICNFVICNDSSLRSQPVIFNPDFFVEKLRHEKPEVFTELVVSNITRLIDLPGTELAQLMGEVDLKLPGGAGPASGFFRSLMSLKRKGKRCVCEGKQVSARSGRSSYYHKALCVVFLFTWVVEP